MFTRNAHVAGRAFAVALVTSVLAAPVQAQDQADDQSRAALIAQEKNDKAATLHPFVPGAAEKWLDRAQDIVLSGGIHWHPFFDSAYSGGGFTVGAGYQHYVSDYNLVDVRGSWTVLDYKRIEAQFLAPRLFDRRATLSVIGGWREATQVGFYGIGTHNTSKDDRLNYSFQQPYASASLDVMPTRRLLHLGGAFDISQWKQDSGSGNYPSVETVYTPATLPGLGANPTYLHTQGTVGIDSRPAPGYARRGGYYAITLHDYSDTGGDFGFQQIDYDAIQHIPILREAWVVSLHGLVETTYGKSGQEIPFFMLPALGSGSTLRGFSSWRFRDNHRVMVQAEWRAMINRFLDLAVFYDAGKVTANRSDLDLSHLKDDYGAGIRLHSPWATPLRIDFAKSNEGFSIVFAASAVF